MHTSEQLKIVTKPKCYQSQHKLAAEVLPANMIRPETKPPMTDAFLNGEGKPSILPLPHNYLLWFIQQ